MKRLNRRAINFYMFETTKKIGPKVVKRLTPWWIRWFYSICGDRFKMATSSIVPDGVTTSDSVVCCRAKKKFKNSIKI